MPRNGNSPRIVNKKKILIILASILVGIFLLSILVTPLFATSLEDIYYSITAERLVTPLESSLDKYMTSNINESFKIGDRIYEFRNNVLYYINDDDEVLIGNLKLDFVRNIADSESIIFRYTFKENGQFYYISGDSLYRIEDKLFFLSTFKQNSEGFYVKDGNLYYAYGWKKRITVPAIVGPIGKTYKRYQYAKINLSTLESEEVSKATYFELNPASQTSK